MKVFALIVFIILILGFTALIIWQGIELVKTIIQRHKEKKEKAKDTHEKGNN